MLRLGQLLIQQLLQWHLRLFKLGQTGLLPVGDLQELQWYANHLRSMHLCKPLNLMGIMHHPPHPSIPVNTT